MYTKTAIDPPKAKAILTRLVEPRKQSPGFAASADICQAGTSRLHHLSRFAFLENSRGDTKQHS